MYLTHKLDPNRYYLGVIAMKRWLHNPRTLKKKKKLKNKQTAALSLDAIKWHTQDIFLGGWNH